MDRSLVIGLASFALTASLLALPAIANQHGTDQHSASEQNSSMHRTHAGGPMSREQMESRLAERFAAADTDGSGSIDPGEAEARHAVRRADMQARLFARMDADSDGEISVAERDTARANRSARRGSLRDRMIAENSNMRGRVTPEMQADLDGGDTQQAPSANRQANRLTRRNAAWDVADADGNGALNRTEFETMVNARDDRREARGTTRFNRMDSDSDGLLSLEELSARPLAMFERADADDDGMVTREERQSARQAMRDQHGTQH